MPAAKTLRLNEQLRKLFEEHCRNHLLDERSVVEAWLLRFLEASEDERRDTAARYAEWAATHSTRRRSRTTSRSATPRQAK
jgi:hypothetical protein